MMILAGTASAGAIADEPVPAPTVYPHSLSDLLISVNPPAPHTIRLEAGPRAIQKATTIDSYELWFEDQPIGAPQDVTIDFNDVVLRLKDNGNDSVTITLLFGESHHQTSDLIDGSTQEVIWPSLYHAGGTALGAEITVNGTIVPEPAGIAVIGLLLPLMGRRRSRPIPS